MSNRIVCVPGPSGTRSNRFGAIVRVAAAGSEPCPRTSLLRGLFVAVCAIGFPGFIIFVLSVLCPFPLFCTHSKELPINIFVTTVAMHAQICSRLEGRSDGRARTAWPALRRVHISDNPFKHVISHATFPLGRPASVAPSWAVAMYTHSPLCRLHTCQTPELHDGGRERFDSINGNGTGELAEAWRVCQAAWGGNAYRR